MQIIKDLTDCNYNIGNNPQWIVIHYTANNGDTAKGNCNYFKVYRGASANYFVDENEVRCCIEPKNSAWHCGDNASKNGCTNYNSIGIEMCSRKDSNGVYYIKEETQNNTAELVKKLMEQYNIPLSRVCRHYDVTGKICPEPFVRDVTQWQAFLRKVREADMTREETEKICNDMIYKYNKLLKDEILSALDNRIEKFVKSSQAKRYKSLDEIPEWGRKVVETLIEKGALKGTDKGLELSEDMLRILVILHR